VKGSCEHGNEASGSIKYCEILQWPSSWRLLEEESSVVASTAQSVAQYRTMYVNSGLRRTDRSDLGICLGKFREISEQAASTAELNCGSPGIRLSLPLNLGHAVR
jgi:hypothetical protein